MSSGWLGHEVPQDLTLVVERLPRHGVHPSANGWRAVVVQTLDVADLATKQVHIGFIERVLDVAFFFHRSVSDDAPLAPPCGQGPVTRRY